MIFLSLLYRAVKNSFGCKGRIILLKNNAYYKKTAFMFVIYCCVLSLLFKALDTIKCYFPPYKGLNTEYYYYFCMQKFFYYDL